MSVLKKIIFSLIFLCFSSSIIANTHNIEQIVVIRHGEKPLFEIGQLNCEGLNRSLLLPAYFKKNFPAPDYLFAPNPSVKIKGYSYIRPLATIEPTAISLDKPVNAQIGYNQPQKLMKTLLKLKYHSAVIYVAWEHVNIQKFAKMLLKTFHNSSEVPYWSYFNYNRVYVFTIDWNKSPAKIAFEITSENMHHLSDKCAK